MPLTQEQITNRNTWCDALESGKYEQATGALKKSSSSSPNGFGYCCLGVARECFPDIDQAEDNELLLNDDAEDYLGLSDDDQDELASENDNGKSFKEIAALIRESTKTGNTIYATAHPPEVEESC